MTLAVYAFARKHSVVLKIDVSNTVWGKVIKEPGTEKCDVKCRFVHMAFLVHERLGSYSRLVLPSYCSLRLLHPMR